MRVFLKPLLLTGLAGIVLALLFYQWRSGSTRIASKERIDLIEHMEAAGLPNIKGQNIQGQIFDLEKLRGKAIIVNFWASWCAPCVEELPALVKLVDEFKGEVHLVAVSADNTRQEMDNFLKSFPQVINPNVHVVFDEGMQWMKLYAVERLPESFVAGRDLKLAKKVVGKIEWYTPDSIQFFQELLK